MPHQRSIPTDKQLISCDTSHIGTALINFRHSQRFLATHNVLVQPKGFEPLTFTVSRCCSTTELRLRNLAVVAGVAPAYTFRLVQAYLYLHVSTEHKGYTTKIGAARRIRTSRGDTLHILLLVDSLRTYYHSLNVYQQCPAASPAAASTVSPSHAF